MKPKLRFKEFNKDWIEVKLNDVVDFLDGKRKPLKDSERHKMSGIYPYYGASGIIDYINNYIFDESLILLGEDGANILTRNTRLAFIAEGKYWVNNHAHVLKPINNNNLYFLCELLESKDYSNYNTGTAQPKLNQEVCKNILLNIPQIDEQVKIASLLKLLNKKIELQKQKIEALKLYKKGLFNQYFNNFKEFTTIKLGNICEITTGKLDANAMKENGKYRFYTCAKEYYFIDNYAFDTEALLISGNGANVGYIHYYNGKFNAYQRTYVLSNFSQNIKYIKIYLDKYLSSRIANEKREGNTPYITLSTINDMYIKIPSIKLQNQIINSIELLDNKILLEEQLLHNLELLKKSLLQQMFI